MRARRPIRASLLVAALVSFLSVAGPAHAERFGVKTLSNPNDTVSEFRPRMAGGMIVWQRGSGAFSEVMMWDGTATVPLSANGVADENPETDGIHVVWQQGSTGSRDIAVYDRITQAVTVLTAPGDQILPVVFGATIAWVQMVDADGEVFIEPGPIGNQLTGNLLVESDLSLDGENLVFVQGDDLHQTPGTADDPHDIGIWNALLHEFYILGSPANDDVNPSVAGNTIVWQVGADGSGGIWIGDTVGSLNQLYPGTNDRNPFTDGTVVVWDHFDGSDRDIYKINLASPNVVSFVTTDNSGDDVTPKLFGNDIVWVHESTPGDSEIWISRNGAPGAPIAQTVGNGRDEVDPLFDGDAIVWESCTNLGQPNELCDIQLAPEPRATLGAAATLSLLAGLATRSARRAQRIASRSAR